MHNELALYHRATSHSINSIANRCTEENDPKLINHYTDFYLFNDSFIFFNDYTAARSIFMIKILDYWWESISEL